MTKNVNHRHLGLFLLGTSPIWIFPLGWLLFS